MAMRVEKTVPALGREVKVIELTVSEIRGWLAEVGAKKEGIDIADQLLFEDVALSELQKMTDLTAAEIDGAPPSELRTILAKCREVNSDFFALRSRLMTVGAKVEAIASGS